MINNNRQKDNKADKQSWIDVFARTQKLRTTGDESWKKDVPNIKLSRAFIVVLILHVVAVGGILAFELFKPDEAKLSVMTEQAVDEKLDDKNVIDEKKERRLLGISVEQEPLINILFKRVIVFVRLPSHLKYLELRFLR